MSSAKPRSNTDALSTFSFTQQFVSDPKALPTPPDNWETAGISTRATTAGSYFSTRLPDIATGATNRVTAADIDDDVDQEQQHSVIMNRKSKKQQRQQQHHRKVTPAERQEEMDRRVLDQMLKALEEQVVEDNVRLEACKMQREVERLKLHQRTKHRLELQRAASQTIHDKALHSIGGIDKPPATNLHKMRHKALREQTHATYIDFNRSRIDHNARHREVCRESHQERVNRRLLLEEKSGTFFTKRKQDLWGTLGVCGADATLGRYPTNEDLYKSRLRTAQEQTRSRDENSMLNREVVEVTAMDDTLWKLRRDKKGDKTARQREIPFSIDANLTQTK